MVGRTLSSELVTCGDFSCADPNDYWDLEVSWSIVDGKLKSDGTFGKTAFQENIFSQAGSTYKIKFDVNVISGSLSTRVRMGDPINGHTTISNITSEGSYTLYATAVANQDNLNFTTLSDNTAVYTIDNVSVKEVIDTNNIPRISYDSNGDNGHILLEPTSTNLITYSEDFSQSAWVKQSNITPTYNTTETLSPDGTYNATKFIGNGSDGVFVQASVTGVITRSVYLKSVTSTVNVVLKDPVLTQTAKTLTLNETWQRYDLSESNQHGSLSGLWIDDIPSSGIYMWGAQIEALPYATSYIPTLTGSQETRATETANGAGSADLINSTEGVLYAEIAALDDGISQQIGVYGNSTSKQLRIEIANSVIRAQLFNGAYQANMSSTQTVTNFNKIAFKWKVNDFALWINGTEVATDSSGSTFPANDLDRLNLSGQNGISSLAQAKIKSLAVFNEALSDSELTQLTT